VAVYQAYLVVGRVPGNLVAFYWTFLSDSMSFNKYKPSIEGNNN